MRFNRACPVARFPRAEASFVQRLHGRSVQPSAPGRNAGREYVNSAHTAALIRGGDGGLLAGVAFVEDDAQILALAEKSPARLIISRRALPCISGQDRNHYIDGPNLPAIPLRAGCGLNEEAYRSSSSGATIGSAKVSCPLSRRISAPAILGTPQFLWFDRTTTPVRLDGPKIIVLEYPGIAPS